MNAGIKINRSKIKVPGNLAETFGADEEVCIVVESVSFKPKMHPKKLIITNKRAVIYKPGFVGGNYDDYPLESIINIDIKKA